MKVQVLCFLLVSTVFPAMSSDVVRRQFQCGDGVCILDEYYLCSCQADCPTCFPDPYLPSIKASCPEVHCTDANVTVMEPLHDCNSSNVEAIQLNSSTYNEETLIELLGPQDPLDAAAVVISVPHGGDLIPNDIPDRNTTGSYCPESGCKTAKDSYTLEIAMEMVDKFIRNYCKVPYVVINSLHRSKLDPNREVEEAAQGDSIASQAWFDYHNFIAHAQHLLMNQLGTVTNTQNQSGIPGLVLDIHGYNGYEWDDSVGSPFINWGYRLSSATLDPTNDCPIDTRSPTGTIGTLSHARFLPNQSLECLVRGPGSLGSRVAAPLDGMGLCGAGLPSYSYPSPEELANDCTFCDGMCGSSPEKCNYFSGDYIVRAHEYLEWQNGTEGVMMNAINVELPRCIRHNSTARELTADAISIAMCSWLRDVYEMNEVC